jgi:hypothetical protein
LPSSRLHEGRCYGRTMELFLADRRVEAEEAVTLGW